MNDKMNELTTTKSGELAIPKGAWGAGQNIDKSDIRIQVLKQVQKNMKALESGKAKLSDILRRDTNQVVATPENPLQIIVFGVSKVVCEKVGSGAKTTKLRPMSDFATRPIVDEPDKGITRWVGYKFLVMVPEGPAKSRFPYELYCLNKSGANFGKSLCTLISELTEQELPSAARVFRVDLGIASNENGDFGIMTPSVLRDTTDEELKLVFEWYKVGHKLVSEDAEVEAELDEEHRVF